MLNDKPNGVPRLGVPPFGHTECTHGTLNDGQLLTTLFPQDTDIRSEVATIKINELTIVLRL